MGSDGVRDGYDLEQLRAVRAVCGVPLVASGGAGAIEHFADVFREADVDARAGRERVPLAARSRFRELKRHLRGQGIEVRDALTHRTQARSTRWPGTSRTACCRRSCRTPTHCAC